MPAEEDLGADHQRRGVDGLVGLVSERVIHPPERQCVRYRGEVEARLGEPIPDFAAPAGRLARQYTGGFELAETVGEPGRRDVREAAGEIGEALRPQDQVAHDKQGPSLADDLERARHHAEVSIDATGIHAPTRPLPTRCYRVDSDRALLVASTQPF
jgi:hypothetical protein